MPDRDDQFRDEPTPIEELSVPIVEPTLVGLANAIIRLHTTQNKLIDKVSAQTREIRVFSGQMRTLVDRDECFENRNLCAAGKRRRPSTEAVMARGDAWAWLGKRIPVMVSTITLLAMLGGGWLWTSRQFARATAVAAVAVDKATASADKATAAADESTRARDQLKRDLLQEMRRIAAANKPKPR